MQKSFKKSLYTIILWYKSNTYIYQILAIDQVEAQLEWIKELDLNQVRAINFNGIQEELIADAKEEHFFPVLINKLHNIWNTTITSLSHNDSVNKEYPIAYIIKTSKVVKNKILYTIQLDYKNNIDIKQISAYTPTEAKIKWIEKLDFNVIDSSFVDTVKVKNDVLINKNHPDFIPQELKEFDSVWSTTVQLGDEVGRVTIVATQTDFLHSDRL